MRPCGVILLVRELFVVESLSQVYQIISAYFCLYGWPKYLGFDNGCRLWDTAQATLKKVCNELTLAFAKLIIVIDRYHGKTHKDPRCKKQFNMNCHAELKGVDSQICEQTFRWLAGYKHTTKHMNKSRYNIFLIRVACMHNENKKASPAMSVELDN